MHWGLVCIALVFYLHCNVCLVAQININVCWKPSQVGISQLMVSNIILLPLSSSSWHDCHDPSSSYYLGDLDLTIWTSRVSCIDTISTCTGQGQPLSEKMMIWGSSSLSLSSSLSSSASLSSSSSLSSSASSSSVKIRMSVWEIRESEKNVYFRALPKSPSIQPTSKLVTLLSRKWKEERLLYLA